MATARKPSTPKRTKKLTRPNPTPRRNPKLGPPVNYHPEGGTIPIEEIEAVVDAIFARRKQKP